MKTKPLLFSIGLFISGAAFSALAQTPTSDTVKRDAQPKAVGTSQQTANEAIRKAVPRGDVATAVRTDSSAADKVSDATTSTKKAKVSKARHKAKPVKTDS